MNPVQFKISSTEEITSIKGMTVFNTEYVDTKKATNVLWQTSGNPKV